jgi:hypothetical protein
MREARLTDAVRRGMGVAARAAGEWAEAFRADGPSEPLRAGKRYLRLPAVFAAADGGFEHPPSYGHPLWIGVFDAAYTRVGDYLVAPSGTWFVAAQTRLMPVLCVRTNRVVSLLRPSAPVSVGVGAYGGIQAELAVPLMTSWPASVLSAGGGGLGAELPADAGVGSWAVLMPAWPGVVLRTGDLMCDDLGRSGVVAAAELTELGWRLSVRQAAS